ncbi:MAG: hypothetical protein H7339_20155 [Arcicella sp.]|nr:hypothetical protein [Arcicella sp.]
MTRMIFVDAHLKCVNVVHLEISIKNLWKYIQSFSFIIEKVANMDDMLINANPKSDENSWLLNDKIYFGNALMYSKIEENGDSGCIWDIDDFRQLITFL